MAADDSPTNARALAPALPAPTGTLATLDAETPAPTELAATLRFADAAKAENTRRAYASDWADFCRWAAARGTGPCPARPACCAAICRPWRG